LLRTVVFNLSIGDTRATGCITQQLTHLESWVWTVVCLGMTFQC
jgi:hypothetical protein